MVTSFPIRNIRRNQVAKKKRKKEGRESPDYVIASTALVGSNAAGTFYRTRARGGHYSR
jgi:hypothetical protein